MTKEDTLQKIREAESQVREVKAAADKERERILRDARREALELRDRLSAEAEQHYDALMEEASTAIERDRQVALERGKEEAAELRANGETNLGPAVDHLLRTFRGAIGV